MTRIPRYVWAAAAGLLLTICATILTSRDVATAFREMPEDIAANKDALNACRDSLNEFRKSHGRYPTNDEWVYALVSHDREMRRHWGLWQGDRKSDDLARAWQLMSLSGSDEPFIYENRTLAPAEAFHGSLATLRGDSAYSRKVSDGVYVWSPASRATYLSSWKYMIFVGAAIVLLGIGGFVAWFIYVRAEGRWRWQQTSFVRRLLSYVGSLLLVPALAVSGFILSLCGQQTVTCYVPAAPTYARTPYYSHEYRSLVSTYHDRGVISDAAYDKLKKAMEERVR